jgi:hypothetical protein
MSDRLRPPHRRQCDAVSFEHGGVAYVGKISRFEDGRIAEAFLTPSVKSGTTLSHMANALAVTASLALQHGAEACELAHALPKLADGKAADPLGKLLELVNASTGSAQQEG